MKRLDHDIYDPLLCSDFTPARRSLPKNVELPHGLSWDMLPDLPFANRNTRRLITRSGARVRGIFQHPRIGRCEWESSLERSLYTLLSMAGSVSRVFSQPLVVNLSAGEYTPDALVFLVTGKRVWIECKPQRHLDAEVRTKLTEATLTFMAAGDRFVIVDETCLDENLPTVVNARLFSAWYEQAADRVPVINEPKTYAALTAEYGFSSVNRAVARGELTLNLDTELSVKTLLWTPKEGEGYEPDFLRA